MRAPGPTPTFTSAGLGRRRSDHLSAETPTTVIRRTTGWARLDLRDLWSYRELVFFLAWRDVSVRYKQTILGITWVILQPLLLMAMFTFIFGMLVRVPSDGLPYPLFVFAGLLPWQFFAHSLMEAGTSVVANERLITKVYFPRLVIPLASVIAGTADLVVALALLVPLMIFYQSIPGMAILALPLFLLMTVATALGVGLWLAALNVRFRDVRYTLPFLTQLWFLATPVIYPSSVVPEPWRQFLGLNPMAGVIEGFRWSLLGAKQPSTDLLIVSAVASFLLVVTGLFYFRRMERGFADII